MVDPIMANRLPGLQEQELQLIGKLAAYNVKIAAEFGDLVAEGPAPARDPRDQLIHDLQIQNAELRTALEKRQRGEA
jgi:hypothetical protein